MLKFDLIMDDNKAERILKRLRLGGLVIRDFAKDYGRVIFASPEKSVLPTETALYLAGIVKKESGRLSVIAPDRETGEELRWLFEYELPDNPVTPGDIRVIDDLGPEDGRTETALLLPGVLPGDFYGKTDRLPEITICLKNRMGIENNFERLFSPMRRTNRDKRKEEFIAVNNRLKEYLYGGQLFVRTVLSQMSAGFPDRAVEEIKNRYKGETLKEYKKLMGDYCRLYERMEAGDLPEDGYFDSRYMVFWLLREGLKRQLGTRAKDELMEKARRFEKESEKRRSRLKERRYEIPVREVSRQSEFLQYYCSEEIKEEIIRMLQVIRADTEFGVLSGGRIGEERFVQTVLRITAAEVGRNLEGYPFLKEVANMRNFAYRLFEYPEVLKVGK